jgi:hypothetical protein
MNDSILSASGDRSRTTCPGDLQCLGGKLNRTDISCTLGLLQIRKEEVDLGVYHCPFSIKLTRIVEEGRELLQNIDIM